MENGECNNMGTCDMKHPEVYYNIQYYNYCPRTDTDCKFYIQKQAGETSKKTEPRKLLPEMQQCWGSYYLHTLSLTYRYT